MATAQASHDVHKRLPFEVPPDLIPDKLIDSLVRSRTVAGDVWGNEDVRQRPQGALRRERLGIGDVKRGVEPTRLELIDEGLRIDHGATARVDEERSRLEPGEPLLVDQSPRLGRGG